MRGTVQSPVQTTPVSRFIPACAGNSRIDRSRRGVFAVHPRVCGEQGRSKCTQKTALGSSPRVRGTGCLGCSRKSAHRFIPACAGNRISRQLKTLRHTVHPRVCGEQPAVHPFYCSNRGSSPRVRGTGRHRPRRPARFRFIPACAGNRGLNRAKLRANMNSSPRVRGTGVSDNDRNRIRRFIPACAGNRSQFLAILMETSVHPRVCGEQAMTADFNASWSGSSPRVRGTAGHHSERSRTKRFIPACAGNRARSE